MSRKKLSIFVVYKKGNEVVPPFLKINNNNKMDMIMKPKKHGWLLKLSYVTDDGKYTVSYVNVFSSTKNEVMHIVDKYRKESVDVRVYKLQIAF